MSITSCGSVAVWSDVLTSTDVGEDSSCITMSTSFQKEYIKIIKLSESTLRVIRSIDGYVMVSDAVGHIRFYDKDLKILFWCPSHDSIDSIVTISFDLVRKPDDINLDADGASPTNFSIRDFFVRKKVFLNFWSLLSFPPTSAETKSDIFSVDVSLMKFNRIFYKSDDFITAIDVFPQNRNLICCGNYSGRIFIYDYERKVQVVENQLKLNKRKISTSDTDVIEIPHVSTITFSYDGHHLLCGLESGMIVVLDPNVVTELTSINVSQFAILCIKFSPDSSFAMLYVRLFNFHWKYPVVKFFYCLD